MTKACGADMAEIGTLINEQNLTLLININACFFVFQFFLLLILGAPYSSYTVYRCSLLEIERPEIAEIQGLFINVCMLFLSIK
jgi:hypothetical protein